MPKYDSFTKIAMNSFLANGEIAAFLKGSEGASNERGEEGDEESGRASNERGEEGDRENEGKSNNDEESKFENLGNEIASLNDRVNTIVKYYLDKPKGGLFSTVSYEQIRKYIKQAKDMYSSDAFETMLKNEYPKAKWDGRTDFQTWLNSLGTAEFDDPNEKEPSHYG
jgi:uncharacterized FlaG/YvyC family protein